MNSVLNQILEVIGPLADVVYALDWMSNSTDSFDSFMALDANMVREDSPDSAQPSVSARWSCFTSSPYAAEHVLSTLSRSRLEDFRHT